MTDKYYTPSIEEFYVGFEFERLFFKDIGWEKQIIEKKGYFIDLIDDFKYLKQHIRVKYLSKDDIRSFNVEFHQQNMGGALTHFGTMNDTDEDMINISYDENWHGCPKVGIQVYRRLSKSFMNRENQAYKKGHILRTHMKVTEFNGYIKNISEFKKILTMMKIEYEQNNKIT